MIKITEVGVSVKLNGKHSCSQMDRIFQRRIRAMYNTIPIINSISHMQWGLYCNDRQTSYDIHSMINFRYYFVAEITSSQWRIKWLEKHFAIFERSAMKMQDAKWNDWKLLLSMRRTVWPSHFDIEILLPRSIRT